MKKKCIFVIGLIIAILTACSNTQETAPNTYKLNTISVENNTEQNNAGSEYEIDDMLPRPSDDTRIMSVEEAKKFMKNRANTNVDTNTNAESPEMESEPE